MPDPLARNCETKTLRTASTESNSDELLGIQNTYIYVPPIASDDDHVNSINNFQNTQTLLLTPSPTMLLPHNALDTNGDDVAESLAAASVLMHVKALSPTVRREPDVGQRTNGYEPTVKSEIETVDDGASSSIVTAGDQNNNITDTDDVYNHPPAWITPKSVCSTCKGRVILENKDLYYSAIKQVWSKTCRLCLEARKEKRRLIQESLVHRHNSCKNAVMVPGASSLSEATRLMLKPYPSSDDSNNIMRSMDHGGAFIPSLSPMMTPHHNMLIPPPLGPQQQPISNPSLGVTPSAARMMASPGYYPPAISNHGNTMPLPYNNNIGMGMNNSDGLYNTPATTTFLPSGGIAPDAMSCYQSGFSSDLNYNHHQFVNNNSANSQALGVGQHTPLSMMYMPPSPVNISNRHQMMSAAHAAINAAACNNNCYPPSAPYYHPMSNAASIMNTPPPTPWSNPCNSSNSNSSMYAPASMMMSPMHHHQQTMFLMNTSTSASARNINHNSPSMMTDSNPGLALSRLPSNNLNMSAAQLHQQHQVSYGAMPLPSSFMEARGASSVASQHHMNLMSPIMYNNSNVI